MRQRSRPLKIASAIPIDDACELELRTFCRRSRSSRLSGDWSRDLTSPRLWDPTFRRSVGALASYVRWEPAKRQQFDPPLKTLQHGITLVGPVVSIEGVGKVLRSRPSTEALGSPRLSTGLSISVMGAGDWGHLVAPLLPPQPGPQFASPSVCQSAGTCIASCRC